MKIEDMMDGVRLGRYRAELEPIHDSGGLWPAVQVHMVDLASPDLPSWNGPVVRGEEMIDLWLSSGATLRRATS